MEVKITIGSDEYYVPKKITVELFEKAMVWDIGDEKNIKPFVATILQCSLHDIDKLEEEVYGFISGVCIHRMSLWGEELHEEIDGHSLKPFDQLTFGEWVDLDCWIAEGINNILDKMLEILAPDVETSAEGLYVIESYITWRTYIYRQYAELFGINVEDDEIVEEPVEKEVGPKDIVNGWYSVIIGLASDNILNVDAVTEQPVIATLNFMAHQKQKQIAENFKKLKQQKEYELQRRRK